MVDDATGRTMCHFAPGETTWGALTVLRQWIVQYGVPRALYIDGAGVYKPPSRRDNKRRPIPQPGSQFARICAALGIRLLVASSPQAKGRVERAHGTHQDRLIKKMRRASVASLAAGNAFLPTYLRQHNARFAVPAASDVDFHRPAPNAMQLAALWQLETVRVVAADGVIRYDGRELQLERAVRHRVPDRSQVIVREAEDGTLTVIQRTAVGDRSCAWHPAPLRPAALRATSRSVPRGTRDAVRTAAEVADARRPSHNHPWRKVLRAWYLDSLAAKQQNARGHF